MTYYIGWGIRFIYRWSIKRSRYFPKINDKIRNKLNLEFDTSGIKNLCERLKVVDPEYYNIVDLNNHRRVIRALEVYYSTKKPYSSF